MLLFTYVGYNCCNRFNKNLQKINKQKQYFGVIYFKKFLPYCLHKLSTNVKVTSFCFFKWQRIYKYKNRFSSLGEFMNCLVTEALLRVMQQNNVPKLNSKYTTQWLQAK